MAGAMSLAQPSLADLPVASPALSGRVRHLLEAARAAFVAEGFDGVSIDAIALSAGVSKETIYRHFPDKPALFRAALEDMGGRFWQRTVGLQGQGDGGLEGMARAILDSAIEGGLLSPLWLVAGLAGRMPEFARDLQHGQWRRLEPLREALERHARGSGLATPVPIALALDFGSLAVEGAALLLGFPPPAGALRDAVAGRVAALFEGGLPALTATGAIPDRPDESAAPPADWPPHLRRVLDVAAAQFLACGYEATTLAEVRTTAQVGRGTLYRHFASKDGLYRAVLRDRAAAVIGAAVVPALSPEADEARLAAFLAAAAENLASPLSLELQRSAISASRREPALAREIHDSLRRPWLEPLADWIAATTGLPDACWLARQALVLALQGNRLFAAARPLVPGEAQRQARTAAAILLGGYLKALAAVR